MNAQNAHLFLPYVQALIEGKEILLDGREMQTEPLFNLSAERYSIKPAPPKPRECWCYVGSDGKMVSSAMTVEKPANRLYRLFREVLPEP